MPFRLKITARNVEEAARQLRETEAKARDLRPVLMRFGVHMIRSIEKNFQAGGRPTPWPPSMRAIRKGGKTLIDTARLKNSIVAQVIGDRTLRVGTNVAYAAAHQFGFSGTVTVPEHIRMVRQAFGRRLPQPVAARVRQHSRRLRLPARPFVLVQDEDLVILRQMVEAHLEGKK